VPRAFILCQERVRTLQLRVFCDFSYAWARPDFVKNAVLEVKLLVPPWMLLYNVRSYTCVCACARVYIYIYKAISVTGRGGL
jgi:hypothetical protein